MYYLVVRPETVVSVVQSGKLPNKIPDWLKLNSLVCAHKVEDSFDDNTTFLDQAFVLELDIKHQDEFLFLESFLSTDIKRIFTYSQRGKNLLNRLFNQNCPLPIIIQPDIYPKPPEQSKKRALDESSALPAPAAKKRALSPVASANNPATNTTPNQKLKQDIVSRIATYPEHLELLQLAFTQAKKTILITSYSINKETFLKANLYELIPSACSRGVKIYIYHNDYKFINKNIMSFLSKHGVFCEEAYTHSKILAVDSNLIVTGSFNWLSTINSKYPESEEGSLVFRGKICEDLKKDFWEYIKYYRHQQFANKKAIREFKRDPDHDSTIIYDLDNHTELGYMPSLDQQCGFFQACFEEAKQHLIICSPFISSKGEYQDDIDQEVLRNTVNRGVKIFFVCSENSDSLNSFRNFLSKVNSPNIYLIPVSHIHLKTIIIDYRTIAEGSFNWLSAMRDEESDYHNHEQTLYVQGAMAKTLIEHFFQSRVGTIVKKQMDTVPKQNNPTIQSSFFATATKTTQSKDGMLNHDTDLQIAIAASLEQQNTTSANSCVIS